MIEMTPVRRSAILLLCLDEDSAAEVIKFLPPKDVEVVSMEMARLTQISHEEMRQVLEEFMDETEQYAAINIHSSDHIRAVLTKALGSERATSLMLLPCCESRTMRGSCARCGWRNTSCSGTWAATSGASASTFSGASSTSSRP